MSLLAPLSAYSTAIEFREARQAAGVSAVDLLWRSGKKFPVIVAPVGFGKTRMTARLAAGRFERGVADFVHVAHRRELVEQTAGTFRSLGLPCRTVLAGGDFDPESPIHSASLATLLRRELRPKRRVAVVSVDEVHLALADSYDDLFGRFRKAYDEVRFVGWTATPYRLDGRPLEEIVDALYEVAVPLELFEAGLILEPRIVAASEPDIVFASDGAIVPEATAERASAPRVLGDVLATYRSLAEGSPAVYFACSVAHSMALRDRFRAAGIRAEHLDGSTPVRERARLLARLSIGGRGSTHPEALDVVFNVDCLREGWDSYSDWRDRVVGTKERPDPFGLWLGRSYPPPYVPLEVVGDLDPTDSAAGYRQREGRVVRSAPGKRRAVLISHSGNWRRHGFLRHHHGFRLGTSGKAPGTPLGARKGPAPYSALTCGKCLSAWPPGTVDCGCCGAPLAAPVALPEEVPAEMKEVSPDDFPAVGPPDREADLAALVELWASWRRLNERRKKEGKNPVAPSYVWARFSREKGRPPGKALLSLARSEEEKTRDEREARRESRRERFPGRLRPRP